MEQENAGQMMRKSGQILQEPSGVRKTIPWEKGALMHLTFKDTKEEIFAYQQSSRHISPHLHHAAELTYVTEGTLELGAGQELYHMERGDLGFIFSDVIHHYQVFSKGVSRAAHILVPPSVTGTFAGKLQCSAPDHPVLRASQLGPDVVQALNQILQIREGEPVILQAYVQIILARCIPQLHLVEKSCLESEDLIYQTVSYISGNFRKQFSLEDMARDLGVSKYVLSRIFSKTFHCNFNQYLNEARLRYASARLEHTKDPVLDICLDSGFESQRTFNRRFKEKYKLTPSAYRKHPDDT